MKSKPKPTSIRIPDKLKKAIKAAAVRDDRSFNGYIVHVLKTSVGAKK